MAFPAEQVAEFVGALWDSSIIPTLSTYISIPNASPMFDKEWATNGYTDQAVELLVNWVKEQAVEGLAIEVIRLEKRTPLILITVEATVPDKDQTVLLYGHMDKQPPMTSSWSEGLHPYTPIIKDGKLYGRGGADDGYAIFASIASILAIKKQGIKHSRYVILVEACEESGSYDLPAYVEHLKDRIGTPSLIICLDSGCGNYEQLWLTSSLRGLAGGSLNVSILTEAVHSGSASGVVPSSFRIARKLLSRIEDENTGKIIGDSFHCDIPEYIVEGARKTVEVLGSSIYSNFPFVKGAVPMDSDIVELVLNRGWRPTLSITGADGLPKIENAGNVIRTNTVLKLSMRLPPLVNADEALRHMKQTLESDPPYNAHVTFDGAGASGWSAPKLDEWLENSVNDASQVFYGKPYLSLYEGGTIPFMGMLGNMFPKAQFVITGVLGPGSNAHGPNEFIHIQYAKKLTACVAKILADCSSHFSA